MTRSQFRPGFGSSWVEKRTSGSRLFNEKDKNISFVFFCRLSRPLFSVLLRHLDRPFFLCVFSFFFGKPGWYTSRSVEAETHWPKAKAWSLQFVQRPFCRVGRRGRWGVQELAGWASWAKNLRKMKYQNALQDHLEDFQRKMKRIALRERFLSAEQCILYTSIVSSQPQPRTWLCIF